MRLSLTGHGETGTLVQPAARFAGPETQQPPSHVPFHLHWQHTAHQKFTAFDCKNCIAAGYECSEAIGLIIIDDNLNRVATQGTP